MKHKLAVFALALAIFAGGEMAAFEEKAQAGTSFGFSLFYNSLSPYGSWVPINGYGYGWYPTQAGPGWQPYMDGQWVWSDQGWTWVSYEPWGWATYHYGRWIYDSYYGWTWIPGTTWAPAYVSWYQSPGYVGWSPLPPDNNFFIEIGISIVNYNYGYNGGYYGGYNGYYGRRHGHHYNRNNYYAPWEHCVFVPEGKFNNRNAKLVALQGDKNLTVMRNVKNVTNIKRENSKVYNYGPDRTEIERAVKGKLQPVKLVDSDLTTSRSGKNIEKNNYKVFRPNIEKKPDESPFNGEGVVNRGVKSANRTPGTKNGLTASGADKGNGLVQKRSINTGKNKPYGNAEPDGYGVISRDPGKTGSAPALGTRKRPDSGPDINLPGEKPADRGSEYPTVRTRNNNTYNGPSIYDGRNSVRNNTTVNERFRKNSAPAGMEKPVLRNNNNRDTIQTRTMNRYQNQGSMQTYDRAPSPERNTFKASNRGTGSYKAKSYDVEKQAPRYNQPSRKSSSSDNSRYTTTTPRQYTRPSMNSGSRNFNTGSTRSYRSNSFVKNR